MIDGGLHKIAMSGREVYKFAVQALPDSLMEAFEANHVTPSQINHVVTHQANIRIVESVLERVGIPMERCWTNLERYGNTSSASLPLSLDEANRAGHLKEGRSRRHDGDRCRHGHGAAP